MLSPSLLRRHPDRLAAGLVRRGWDSARIAALLAMIRAAPDEAALTAIAGELPNLPDEAVPEERQIERAWGEPLHASWQRPHWKVLADLGWLDAPRGVAIAGSRFTLLRGPGARLERALMGWMLDLHTTQHGYTEVAPPIVVRGATLAGSGHLPHFRDEMYSIASEDDLWLNPTAEAPLVALHAGELLAERHLPLAYAAGLPSFRREAGSAGRQTRGLLRLHQFQKVELVRFTTPEQSPAAFDAMSDHAAAILAALEIPYRIVDLPTPELGFAAARGRDLEAWFAGMGEWIEVASISDCGAFQARRANIHYRPAAGGRPRFVHTLNASGLAVGRTLAALVERCQTPDGEIAIPAILGMP